MFFVPFWRVRILGVDSFGISGLFCPHWAFPITFVVVVVVVLVEFERWSGHVNGFECTRSILGFYCISFVCLTAVLAGSCKIYIRNVRVTN